MKKKSTDFEEKVVKSNEDEIEEHWSIKRILIFSSFLALIGFGVFYFFSLKSKAVLGEADNAARVNSAQIEIPNAENIDEIIGGAEESIANIDANDIVSSQPQIQNAIKQLEKLTNQDNFKDTLCSTICSK